MNTLLCTLIIGAGATAVMDLWGVARKRVSGTPPPDFGLVGRWLGHMPQGKFHHASIAAAAPVRGERLIGWMAHYLTGILFAAILVGIWGAAWIERPTLYAALLVGLATSAAPFLLMQPGMGAGIAASKTSRPGAARRQTLINHTVFGLGLYVAGWAARFLCL